MSQPTHFLERLTRVTPAEGALAAQLARDSTLLRGFLDKAALKDPAVGDAPRVALPLSSAAECAHMIVARDGNAVTCLASGMPMHDVPVLPFVWVTEYAQQADAVLNAAVVLQRDRNPLSVSSMRRTPSRGRTTRCSPPWCRCWGASFPNASRRPRTCFATTFRSGRVHTFPTLRSWAQHGGPATCGVRWP
jgi:hypothetical protein